MPGDGPVPKRSKERRRRNKAVVSEGRTRSAVAWPEPDGDWHVVARDWFLSLKGSGQSQFYEPSDVAAARFVAEAMSRNLNAGRFSGQLFAAVMAAMSELLTTEGARRRARIELERVANVEEPAAVASMAKYRAAAAKAG